jgi:hypothetical protein
MVRRDVVEAVGPFDVSWKFAEDWEFCLRLAARFPFAYVGEKLTRYRIHGQSKTAMSLAHAEGQIKLREYIEQNKAAWLQTCPDSEALRRKLPRHEREYAKVCARLAQLHAEAGNFADAHRLYSQAAHLVPTRLKYRLRALSTALRARTQSAPTSEATG